ncbi:MAG: methyltransferase domain-containing protein [Xanthomonadales bacterium]|nr:methyltransferase domain-containing protein [Xanthomonadales bacterium]
MNFDDFKVKAGQWRKRLTEVKTKNPPDGFTWYGYDILANVDHVDGLLSGDSRDLLARVAGERIADIGCADGDLGLLFADLGHEVDLIDWPSTNWNGMRGVRRLTGLLESPATVHEVDLDSQFALPSDRYGLVVLLGILYHLKNPYFVLDKLASHTRYCLLSTRIARYTKAPKTDISELPVAYLLTPDECNNDATNFWIFSAAGLRRIVERCGFRIVAMRQLGDVKASNPADAEHDERAFLMLESTRI